MDKEIKSFMRQHSRAYLLAIKDDYLEFKALDDRLRSISALYRSPKLDGMPKGRSGDADQLAEKLDAAKELNERMKVARDKYLYEYGKLCEKLVFLEKKSGMCLLLHYVWNWKVMDVCDLMEVKASTFYRWANKGLEDLYPRLERDWRAW